MCSIESRPASRTRSRESTGSCTTSRTSLRPRSNGSRRRIDGNLFLAPSFRYPMRVFVVDNGGQWTHREWRVLKYLGVETKIVPNDTPVGGLQDLDGLVLSGGAPRVGVDPSKMGRNGEYLDAFDGPILGICAGHQFMAKHFGGEAAPAKVPEFGKSLLNVREPDVLFEGLPDRFEVWESHNDEVTVLPPGFVALASCERRRDGSPGSNADSQGGAQDSPRGALRKGARSRGAPAGRRLRPVRR